MEYLFKALSAAIENAAEQRQGVAGAPPPREQPPKAKRHHAPAAPAEAPPLPAVHASVPKGDGGLVPLFEDGKSIVRALVAAEVLGPPVALREPSIWSLRPNEPSI